MVSNEYHVVTCLEEPRARYLLLCFGAIGGIDGKSEFLGSDGRNYFGIRELPNAKKQTVFELGESNDLILYPLEPDKFLGRRLNGTFRLKYSWLYLQREK